MPSSNPYGRMPQTMGECSDVVAYRKLCGPAPQSIPPRVVIDSVAQWIEFGFTAPEELVGNATTGWTDAAGEISWKIQASENLTDWAEDEMIDATVTAIDNLDGTITYWSRRIVPLVWYYVMVDISVGSNRYGKSITGITLFGDPVTTGMDYPYAMPADAATLQADLRAAGFTGATVTTSSAALVAGVKNHISSGAVGLVVTMSGSNVTAVAPYGGSAISLPSYPYAMPGSRATLQTDLRANGYTGAVVMLYADPWEIILPDLAAELRERSIILTISPADPYPVYNFFGAYTGDDPQTDIAGEFSNTRSPLGVPLQEAGKAFFRVKRTALPI